VTTAKSRRNITITKPTQVITPFPVRRRFVTELLGKCFTGKAGRAVTATQWR